MLIGLSLCESVLHPVLDTNIKQMWVLGFACLTQGAEFAHDGDHNNTPRCFVSHNMSIKVNQAHQSLWWAGYLNGSLRSSNYLKIRFLSHRKHTTFPLEANHLYLKIVGPTLQAVHSLLTMFPCSTRYYHPALISVCREHANTLYHVSTVCHMRTAALTRSAHSTKISTVITE